MSKLMGTMSVEGRGDPAIHVSASSGGVEVHADPVTCFTPDQARGIGNLLYGAAVTVERMRGHFTAEHVAAWLRASASAEAQGLATRVDELQEFDAGDVAPVAAEHVPVAPTKPPPAVERSRLELQGDEGDRQLVLLALAQLSLLNPGFDDALNRIAVRIDDVKDGRGELYDEFRRLRGDRPVEPPPATPRNAG